VSLLSVFRGTSFVPGPAFRPDDDDPGEDGEGYAGPAVFIVDRRPATGPPAGTKRRSTPEPTNATHEPADPGPPSATHQPTDASSPDAGEQFDVEVSLAGDCQPIDGTFEWHGRLRLIPDWTPPSGKLTGLLATPHGTARGVLGERDLWGRYRITGRGIPPFPLDHLAPLTGNQLP
jgi:hypothetical protein